MARSPVPDPPGGWALVVPVKVLARAKSRLAALDGAHRAALALAMAADAVAAAAACPAVRRVVVVTDDQTAQAELGRLGAIVIADAAGRRAERGARVRRGLRGAALARLRAGGHGRGPARPAPGRAGPGARRGRRPAGAFVPDADGAGTTLYAAPAGAAFRPQFGPGSRAAHAALGAAEIALPDLDGLRQDVDTFADLRQAAVIGLGPRTRAAAAPLLASCSRRRPGGRPRCARSGRSACG